MNENVMDILKFKNITYKPFEKNISFENVLVFSPHCDDEVLGCGGTLLKLLKKNSKVTIIYFTVDKNFKRENEAKLAWANYNVRQIFLNYADSKLDENVSFATKKVSTILKKTKPDAIFVPWFLDSHEDHIASNKILYNIIKNNLVNFKSNISIVSYEVNYPLYINHSVNISDFKTDKTKIIDKYVSQNPIKLKAQILSLNKYRGLQVGLSKYKWAEAFFISALNDWFCIIKLLNIYETRKENE